MNDSQFAYLSNLSSAEVKDFFILYVGLDCFLKNKDIVKLKKAEFLNEINNNTIKNRILWKPYGFRLKISDSNNTYYLLYNEKERTFCELLKPEEISFKELKSYKDSLPKDVVDLLIDACHNNISRNESHKSIYSLFQLKKLNEFGYRFIIGAGVNYGYDMPMWDNFQTQFENAIDVLFKKGTCKSINDGVFNNNYGYFQIVKDISNASYKKILADMVNSAKEPGETDNSTLTSIASVLYAQSVLYPNVIQRVLTFNYDNLLERALKNCYNEDAFTTFKNSITEMAGLGFLFEVIHSHGFLPKYPEIVQDRHYDSVVLTTDEYFKNYKSPSSYGYSNLYNHLNKICYFVGNSIKDYEEQKVISKYFEEHPSHFHFYCGSIDELPIEAIMYKTIFLLKIGVIPLWYSSHDEYRDEFFDYSKKIIKEH